MRTFHSYGPVDCEEHFCVQRTDLIDRCVTQLIGHPEKGGHYFTIWSPRQCGKTWLMRQAAKKIEADYPNRFTIGMMSMQGVMMKPDEPEDALLIRIPQLFREAFKIRLNNPPEVFEDFKELFSKENDIFKTPLMLFIDEFDSLPSGVIDRLVTLFRDMYLKRESYLLHGLAAFGLILIKQIGHFFRRKLRHLQGALNIEGRAAQTFDP